MIERLKDLPPGIDGVKAIGMISKGDYERAFPPILDDARRYGHRIRFLYELGPEFEGFTPGAAWEDAKIGIHSMRLFMACAIVTDLTWMRNAAHIAAFLTPCPVQVFANKDRDKAIAWLNSIPAESGISHRLLTESGVIVIDVKHALSAQDFDVLSLTADTWIEAHGAIQGIVIHAREFPGWDNLGSLIRHIQFIRDHHRNVKRVALAADVKLASLVPKVAEHFVQAQVKRFEYDELDLAIAWAGDTLRKNAAA
ncbi:MAG TPA: STAS/SEC14 domain-containing protein [Candidatus Acidoferrales bacterium]|nr:STAS/SEC14 domain-containing protein [Candidatus Acidoferrales bacterium]